MNLDRIGKYRVVGRIGKGAMGEVYKAQDPLLNRLVAIKTITPLLAAEPDFRRRFEREAQSAAQLNHPNIVTVFDFGEEEGLVYMAMELLEGRDLRELMRSRGTHLGDKLSIMEQLCDGLGFAHARGIVHRDLKPGNIHVQPNGQVKILDFGLARLGDSDITRTGTVMGTPSYMSPEQVLGQKADARSDVFSLGSIFYELLSNHRPFEAGSDHDVRLRIVEEEPVPIRKWAPDVPPPLVALVDQALAKDPALRFADAGEMGRTLVTARNAIEGETVAGLGAGETERTILQGGDATVVQPSEPRPAHPVWGATALTLARAPADAPRRHLPRTVRPEPTVAGETAARLGPRSRGLLLGAAAATVTVAIAAGAFWMRSRASTPAAAPASGGRNELGIMADVFVTNQVELARADVADQDYASAARRAEEALKLSPGSADAREVLDQARRAQQEIEAGVADARAAFGRGDVGAASEALGRVMTLAPRHPVVAELSQALKQHLRPQAEDSRRQAEGARKAAQDAQALSTAGGRRGGQLVSEADALLRRQDYATAAQRYLEARNAFERAKREADGARAVAAAPSPSARLALGPATATPAAPSTTPVPSPFAPPTTTPFPLPTVSAAPTSPPSTGPLPSPSTSLAPVGASRADGADAEVRRVIAEYGRAIGSQDLALFRSLKPDLTADEEKRLREAFKVVKSQIVGITVESVQVDGDRATVRVTRQDIVNGRPMKPTPQTFRLARSGGGWLIQSIGL